MLANLALGTLLISATVLIHTGGLILLSRWMCWIVGWLQLHRHEIGKTIAMMTVVLGLFFLHTVEIWLWAAAFAAMDVVRGFDNALYFSIATFSTLGSDDVMPAHEWRILAALEGIDGFILIGWSIAYLIAASTRHGPFRIGEHF